MAILRKVSVGQPPRAVDHNSLVDAIQELQQAINATSRRSSLIRNRIVVQVINSDSSTIQASSAVQLFQNGKVGGNLFAYGSDPIFGKSPPASPGETALESIIWGIAEDNILPSEIGNVCIMGECIASVKGGTTGRYADIVAGQASLSATDEPTRAEIVGRIDDEADSYAKILLSGGGVGDPSDQSIYEVQADCSGSTVSVSAVVGGGTAATLQYVTGTIPPRTGDLGINIGGYFIPEAGVLAESPYDMTDGGMDGTNAPPSRSWAAASQGAIYGMMMPVFYEAWTGTELKQYRAFAKVNSQGLWVICTDWTLNRTIETTECEMPEMVDAMAGLSPVQNSFLWCPNDTDVGLFASGTAGRTILSKETTSEVRTYIGLGTFAVENIASVPSLSFGDGSNISLGGSTGTKIGTSTTQKIGFYNATPIAQPADANQQALTDNTGGTAGHTVEAPADDLDTLGGSLGGTPDQTLADVGGTWDATAQATANKNFKELQEQLNKQVAINTTLMDNIASMAAHINALRNALTSLGLIKGAAAS